MAALFIGPTSMYQSETDTDEGKILKKHRPNPTGQDCHLGPDGSVTRDEDKIIQAQRIFKHNYYKPGGKGYRLVLKKYGSGPSQ